MHPTLKRGLAFDDDYYVHPDDVIEQLPRTSLSDAERSAKRRRIERIAAQCLQGKAPVLLTASLRGPFNDGWKNPWTQAKKTKRKSSERADSTLDARASGSTSQKKELSKAKRRIRSASRKPLETRTKIASPETSRAATYDMEDVNESHTLEDIEVPPATAPSSSEHDVSGATEFYSADTGRRVRSKSPLTNPFWLRRTESAERFNMKRSADENIHSSPTRPRSREQGDARPMLHLAKPKVQLGVRNPVRAVSPVDVRSSASAPMVISSPVKPTALGGKEAILSPLQPTFTPAVNAIPTEDLAPKMQPAQVQSLAPVEAPTPATALRDPSPVARLVAAPDSASQHPGETVERPASAPSQPKSSTGFLYKKVEATKWTIGNAPRSKPRAVNFNSSPIVKIPPKASKSSSQHVDVDVQPDATSPNPVDVSRLSEHSQQNAGSQVNEAEEEQQSLKSCRSSWQSAMSTQAAMLLAQLEFQESTFPTSSSRTTRAWSQSQSQETPRQLIPEPSPSITPISVFRPALEQPHYMPSVLRGPPMSTQDLFAAASPFAFSTVKKKPETQHGNLRIAMIPFNDQAEKNFNDSPCSPAASPERTTLKEKNVALSPWSLNFRQSQDSLKARSFHDVDVSQNISNHLHFAERLLRGFDT